MGIGQRLQRAVVGMYAGGRGPGVVRRPLQAFVGPLVHHPGPWADLYEALRATEALVVSPLSAGQRRLLRERLLATCVPRWCPCRALREALHRQPVTVALAGVVLAVALTVTAQHLATGGRRRDDAGWTRLPGPGPGPGR